MKHPLKLPSNTSLERAVEAYADVAENLAENLADSLELMNDLTDELDKLLAAAPDVPPSQRVCLKYLLERATTHYTGLMGAQT